MAERGSQNDVLKLEKILKKDITFNLRETSDPAHILNQRNINGITAMYAAAKAGNLNVVKFLI